MINATVTGNVGKNPEMKQTKTGKAMVVFSLASNTQRGEENFTTWIDCVAFDKLADGIAAQLGKGMRVVASGSMTVETFPKKDGSQGSALRMIVNDLGIGVRSEKKEQETDEPW